MQPAAAGTFIFGSYSVSFVGPSRHAAGSRRRHTQTGWPLVDTSVRNSYRTGMKTTVSEKGQITIPKRLRDRLGLRPGTVLDFEETEGRLVGRKLVTADQLDDLYGILELPPGGTDAFIREIRGSGPDDDES